MFVMMIVTVTPKSLLWGIFHKTHYRLLWSLSRIWIMCCKLCCKSLWVSNNWCTRWAMWFDKHAYRTVEVRTHCISKN